MKTEISMRSLGLFPMAWRLAMLAGLALATTACQQTRFVSLPSGQASACDPEWVGAWRVEGYQYAEKSDTEMYWIVAPECASYETVDEQSEIVDDFQMRYIKQGDTHLLAVASRPDAKKDDQEWENAFMLFRYESDGKDQIRLYAVDDGAAARMIVEDKIKGRTHVSRRPVGDPKNRQSDGIENLIFGSPADTDAAIQRKGIFGAAPWAKLIRTSDDDMKKVRARLDDRRSPEGG